MNTPYKLCTINHTGMPEDVRQTIREYAFLKVNKLSKNDPRYDVLRNIPIVEYDEDDGVSFVYLIINDDRDIYMTVHKQNDQYCKQVQGFVWHGNVLEALYGHSITV